MPKKTFRFSNNKKKFEANCGTTGNQCPAVQFYRAGIDTKVVVHTNKVFVTFPEATTSETIKTMYGMGQSMCQCCRFNANKTKIR